MEIFLVAFVIFLGIINLVMLSKIIKFDDSYESVLPKILNDLENLQIKAISINKIVNFNSENYRGIQNNIDNIKAIARSNALEINSLEKAISGLQDAFIEVDRSLKAPKEELQTVKSPIKLNNWDSMRKAFKVPTRVEDE